MVTPEQQIQVTQPSSCVQTRTLLSGFPAVILFGTGGGLALYFWGEKPKSGFWRYVVGGLVGSVARAGLLMVLTSSCPEEE